MSVGGMSCEIIEGDSSSCSDRSDDKAFISKLLVEMKSQFNKRDDDEDEDEESVEARTEKERALKSLQLMQKKEKNSNDFSAAEDVKKEVETLDDKPRLVLTFRKPSTGSLSLKARGKEETSNKVLRNNRSNITELKRSSRRRSKDCNESVLQSAIARKEKSYNEANKPQRLSKQLKLKPTQKILDNIAKASLKLEKSQKNKKLPKTGNFEGDFNDATSRSDDSIMTTSSSEETMECEAPSLKRSNSEDFRDSKRLKQNRRESGGDQDSDGNSSLEMKEDGKKNLGNERIRRSQRISLRRAKGDDTEDSDFSILEPSTAEQNSVYPAEPECSSVGAQLIASRLCLCTQKTHLYLSLEENEVVYCNAIDSINDKLVGCNRVVEDEDFPMLRPSMRVPYAALCRVHYNRMLRHNCCPTCGIFCTQGQFTQCESKHQYHRGCQITVGDTQCCPHCGTATSSYDVHITLHSSSQPVILPERKFGRKSAKMSLQSTGDLKVIMDSFEKEEAIIPPNLFESMLHIDITKIENCNIEKIIDAIDQENLEKITMILGCERIDLNTPLDICNGGTLLHYACQKGFLPAVHLLKLSGAQLDLLNCEQNTPLMLSVINFKNYVVRYLLKAGSSLSTKSTDGATALHIAAKVGNLPATKLLLSTTSRRDLINAPDDGGWTPLVWACEHGHADVAAYLLAVGADVNVRDVEHNTPLHWAAFSDCSDIIDMLVEYGCDLDCVNVHGDTALHIAARQDKYETLTKLLIRGSNFLVKNKSEETALDCAVNPSDCYNAIALNVRFSKYIKTPSTCGRPLLSLDISNGKEPTQIQCTNTINEEPTPGDFTYVSKNCITSENVQIDQKITSLQPCDCTHRCTTGCLCAGKSKCYYDEEGRITLDFDHLDPPSIFECNQICGCNPITCKNRVVQTGSIGRGFQVFKTARKGWGLKTLGVVQKGAFVCEYVGEVISGAEAERRDDDSYVFDLIVEDANDSATSERYCIDSRHYGNYARFLNHSCEPNIFPVRVFVEQDLRFPKVAFFALRDINAGEELTFDYGERFWVIKGKQIKCECGSGSCRFKEQKTAKCSDEVEEEVETES